jgi:hypothetical protein
VWRSRNLVLALWLIGALLWLSLAAHKSAAPVYLGRWSARMAPVVFASGAALLLGALLVALPWLAPAKWTPRLETALSTLRRYRWPAAALSLAPIVLWIVCGAYLANTDLPFMGRAWLAFAALTGLIAVWLWLLLFADLPAKERKTLAAKIAVAVFSAVLAVLAVEIAGRAVLGSRAVSAPLNPPLLNVSFETDEFKTRVATNREGLREQQTIGKKPLDEKRVAFVGDSVTFGWGVEEDEAFPRLCARGSFESPGANTINAGKPGSALPDYLRVIRENAPAWKDDWIVLGFLVGNDCPVAPPVSLADDRAVQAALERHLDNSAGAGFAPLRSSIVLGSIHRATQAGLGAIRTANRAGKRGPLFGEPNPLDRERLIAEAGDAAARRFDQLEKSGWIERGKAWRVNPWLIRAAIVDPTGVADALGANSSALDRLRFEWRLCEGLLDEAKRVAEQSGSRLCILAIPCPYQVSPKCRQFLRELGCQAPESLATATTINRWLAAYCRRRQILLIDPLDDFLRAPDPASLYYPRDGHPTPAGHRLLAEALIEHLPTGN